MPIRNSRWGEWWYGIGADPGKLKLPSPFYCFRRQAYLDGYLEGLHDAARIVDQHRWNKERGFNGEMTMVIKQLHTHHAIMERKHTC